MVAPERGAAAAIAGLLAFDEESRRWRVKRVQPQEEQMVSSILAGRVSSRRLPGPWLGGHCGRAERGYSTAEAERSYGEVGLGVR